MKPNRKYDSYFEKIIFKENSKTYDTPSKMSKLSKSVPEKSILFTKNPLEKILI